MPLMVFQLQAPLSSWGDTAVGEYRPTSEHPGGSALVGLLGAALGIRREDEAAHASLRDGFVFAVGVQLAGSLLRDYHTAQVPSQASLKKRPHASRRDELALPKDQLHTILSTRDYRQDAACLVAVQASCQAPYSLDELAEALRKPHFVLYLGRKSCPPAAPLNPKVLQVETVRAAFDAYLTADAAARSGHHDKWGHLFLEEPGNLIRVVWGDGINAGFDADLSMTRKDRLIRRQGWQFGNHTEHVALVSREGSENVL